MPPSSTRSISAGTTASRQGAGDRAGRSRPATRAPRFTARRAVAFALDGHGRARAGARAFLGIRRSRTPSSSARAGGSRRRASATSCCASTRATGDRARDAATSAWLRSRVTPAILRSGPCSSTSSATTTRARRTSRGCKRSAGSTAAGADRRPRLSRRRDPARRTHREQRRVAGPRRERRAAWLSLPRLAPALALVCEARARADRRGSCAMTPTPPRSSTTRSRPSGHGELLRLL